MVGFTAWNGFTFQVLALEIGSFEGSLFGISGYPGDYFEVDLLFFNIEIKRPV